MVKKSMDGKFVINFQNEDHVLIEVVPGFRASVHDLAIAISDCFRPEPNERLNVDQLHFVIDTGEKGYSFSIERKHCLLIYLEEISKKITL